MGRIMTETVSARYEFTDKERADLGREIAEIYQHKITLEEEKKANASQFKERADTLDLKSGSLSRQIMAGFEMRQVDCTLQWDHPNVGEVTYWRKDNGAELKVRPMTNAERQLELPLENGGPQLLEFPQQVQNSVEKSAAAISEFFDSADKAQPVETRVEVIPPGDPTSADLDAVAAEQAVTEATAPAPTEPPVDFHGSLEEYAAMLAAEKAVAASELPPVSPPAKKGSKKK